MDQLRSGNDRQDNAPDQVLEQIYQTAVSAAGSPFVTDPDVQARIQLVAQGQGNRSCVRALLACALAKACMPSIDIRKPYTKIDADDTYSGRDYDERFVGPFSTKHHLPVNATTAFLTPAFRNRNLVLTPDVDLVGRPPRMYAAFLQLLTDVHAGRLQPEQLLAEAIQQLLTIRETNKAKIGGLLKNLQDEASGNTLAAEAIVKLIEHHLSMSGVSRLPVLIVAAVYQVAETNLGERLLALEAHNAADKQTGAIGDLQITLIDDANIITAYEMKDRPVTIEAIDVALNKIAEHDRIDNYIFITTEAIDPSVSDYAAKLYARTGGVEIVVLDCIGFLRHFLHLFYRLRESFLNAYQALVLQESESAVGQHLKEAFLLLRAAAEKANLSE
ncbi:MAG: restriction endonuclease, SacI family [Chloroflexi bacterium]|nr:restriction endonuclease, SacI family [Chloroflexota bacterium]